MEPFELEPSSGFEAKTDRRPRMDEPLPVKLIAVDDVRLSVPPGIEKEMDAFYVGLWQFQREVNPNGDLVYRSENFRLRFQTMPQMEVAHESMRPQGIELMSLAEAEQKLIEHEIEHIRQRGLTPGQDSLLLLDPAGHWIELSEQKLIG